MINKKPVNFSSAWTFQDKKIRFKKEIGEGVTVQPPIIFSNVLVLVVLRPFHSKVTIIQD